MLMGKEEVVRGILATLQLDVFDSYIDWLTISGPL